MLYCKGYRNDWVRVMKIINILADGTQVEDMSTITVPIENGLYEVCRGILERQTSDVQSDSPS